MIITVIPDDLSIPEFLKRKDTPENKEAREQIARMYKNRFAQKLEQEKQRKLLSDGEATEKRIEDEADRRWRNWLPTLESRHRPTMAHYRSEVRKEFADKRERKEKAMSKQVGSKENALRAKRENGNGKGVLSKLAKDAEAAAKKVAAVSDEAKLAAALTASTNGAVAFEAAAKKATKKASPKLQTKATNLMEKAAKAAPKAKANGAKPSKCQLAEDMLLDKKGATREELEKVTGWKTGLDMVKAEARVKKTHPKAKLVEKDGRFWFRVAA